MSFRWLKQYMPRSLYGRAALILILPIVLLQLLVSVVFVQNTLDGITLQMTMTVVRQIELVEARMRAGGESAGADLPEILRRLGMAAEPVDPGDVPVADSFRWYDYSARVVRRTLRRALPETLAIDFPDDFRVHLYVATDQGPVRISFGRRRVSAAAPHQLIVSMVAFGALMIVIAFLYMRNQLRPITRLAAAAQAFGRGRVVPYSPSGAVEVRAAGHAFLDMRARIERHLEQRTMMLSGVSHDLRTPLTRLKLGLAMIDDEEAAPLRRDVDEMQRLLDEFLSFARGAAEVEAEPCDPVALVRGVVEDARREGKPVGMADVSGSGEVKLRAVAIRRAVENLIDNAVRYGTRAEVSLSLADRSLRIRVEDDGPGIPEGARAEALKPFARLDPARNQNRGGGVGLGLAITADIARAHGGVLRLGSSDRLGGLQADIVIGR